MALKFLIRNQTLDGAQWGDIDKAVQYHTLKTGITEKAQRVVEAVQEMYAVVKTEVSEDLKLEDLFGPHHTIRQDGTLVLSRGGMIAAAEALAGARTESDLTAEQKRQAARHLLRHYRQEEVNLQPPQLLLDLAGTGEMAYLTTRLAGEMRPTDIPLAPGVDILSLKANDSDPMEVVVEIPSGVSARGWDYGKVVIRHTAEQIMQKPVAGYLGHQRSENLEYEFPTPVTHWVGAVYRDGSAFVRGVVDKAAPDLKRWIRAKVINQVSIYGYMTTEERDGKTHVTGIELLSIDWVPLDRAGMNTRVVAVGEMNKNGGVKQMTLAEILAELRKLGVKPGQVVGEMGWDVKTLAKELGWEFDKVAGEISNERWTQLQEAVKVVGECAQVFGLGKDAKLTDLVGAVKLAKEAQTKAATAEHDKLVEKVIGEMVQAEAVRPLVKRMLQADPASDEPALKKAVGELMQAEDVKKALAEVFKDQAIAPKDGQRPTGGTGTSNTIKRVSI